MSAQHVSKAHVNTGKYSNRVVYRMLTRNISEQRGQSKKSNKFLVTNSRKVRGYTHTADLKGSLFKGP